LKNKGIFDFLQPEISTDGFHPYRVAIRDAFGDSASHGVINKACSVTHLVKEAQGRYSPAAVVQPASLNAKICRCAWAAGVSLA